MNRPFVSINMISSVDGKITSASGESPYFGSHEDRLRLHALRSTACAILVGANTIRCENPPMHPRDSTKHPWHIVMSRLGQLDPHARIFTEGTPAKRIIVTAHTAVEPGIPMTEHWPLGDDLPLLLKRLYAEGVRHLLVEGGGEINAAFFAQDLVDELYLTLAPTLLGGSHSPTIMGGTGLTLATRIALQLVHAERVENELFCRYRIVHEL